MALTDEDARRVRDITHELNNALGLVINYTSLVSRDLHDRPDVADDLAEIGTAGRRAADLVKELSALLRGEAPSA
ncbi:MAG: hypothetical protein M3326_14085 [Actinomycetota bacterium]|nr:hypothetical protein [Actinomycetota bacterium]